MEPIIEISSLGKKYPIVHDKAPYGTLRDSLANFVRHPFTVFGQNSLGATKTRESFWALKGINLSIEKGDIVGIIGKNGAGKSTLLKIISGITKPTEGNIKLYGRVSSLLEVGTGFHSELTGRENIFLNGVILGMTRKEVAKKFDQIVDFAGIEKFLDTPVKHYSSGMYVRLAFAVAAHLEPDILIVDEVLAVGDAEFQKKCLGKMDEISKEEGRTVILVTHNLDVMQAVCKKTLVLAGGKTAYYGTPQEAIEEYLQLSNSEMKKPASVDQNYATDFASISKIEILDAAGKITNQISSDLDVTVKVIFSVKKEIKFSLVSLIFHADNKVIYVVSDRDHDKTLKTYTTGLYETKFILPANTLNPGLYSIEINIQKPDAVGATRYAGVVNFPLRIVSSANNKVSLYGGRVYGFFGTNIIADTVKL
jgi:lipopolysaccharide transport system ATP-binding protein